MYMAGCDYIHICKHIQLESSTETDQAPQPMPELPGCTACERTKEEERGPFGRLALEGNLSVKFVDPL